MFKDGLLPTATCVDGEAFTPSSYLEAPALTSPAVPEPSTWAMLMIGFAGLGLMGWRASRTGAVHAK
jgi:PEP-CTERM motif-containing protein